MPKIKTNRAARKRFRVTKSGEFKRYKAGSRHLKTCKPPKRRRQLRVSQLIDKADKPAVKRMLPYS